MPTPPPVLIVTPGDPAANSYISLVDATTYLSMRGFTQLWDTATVPAQTAALEWATIRLDASFDWKGVAASATQALSWPRSGLLTRNKFPILSTVIPTDLARATAEFALWLLGEDRTSDNDALKLGVNSLAAGSLRIGFQNIGESAGSTAGSLELRDADVIRQGPEFAFLWKAIPDAVRNLLPEHWYRRRMISRPVIFKVSR